MRRTSTLVRGPLESLERRILFVLYGADESFGSGGHVNAGGEIVLAELPGQKILAAGYTPGQDTSDDNIRTDESLTRLNPDGTPDQSFGTNGRIDLGVVSVSAFSGSRIFVFANEGADLEALTVDGKPDKSFSGDGVAPISTYTGTSDTFASQVLGFLPLPDGGFLLKHEETVNSGTPQVTFTDTIVRAKADGSIDSAFGTGGSLVFNNRSGYYSGGTSLFLTGQKFFMLTDSNGGTVLRYNLNGTIDNTFGTQGKVVIGDIPDTFNVQSDGKFVTGQRIIAQHGDMAKYTRYKANGSKDTAFGASGSVNIQRTSDYEFVHDDAIDSQNRIVVATDHSVYRISASGVPEGAPFDGSVTAEEAGYGAYNVAFDSQGRILLGSLDPDVTITRLASLQPVQLGRDGVLYVNGDDADDVVSVAAGTNGKIKVTRNAVVNQTIDLADVTGLGLRLRDGDNEVFVSLDLDTEVRTGQGKDIITTAGGDDDIRTGGGGLKSLALGSGNDIVRILNFPGGENDNSFINGGNGNKNIRQDRGAMTIAIGVGNSDIQTANNGANHIMIAGGNNKVALQADGDVLSIGGSGAANRISVGGDGSSITTGDGNDAFKIYSSGTISSNGGNDSFDVQAASDGKPLEIFAGDGNDQMMIDQSGTYIYPTIFNGGAGNDFAQGSNGSQTLYGNSGKDTLLGGGGSDLVSGNGGNDLLYGESGKDRLYGGDGDDLLDGGRGNDRLFGQNGRDRMYGQSDNDLLYGGPSGDWLYSGRGADEIFGEGGNDHIYGDYSGSNGTLHGGAGDDTFVSTDGQVDYLFGDGGTDSASADQTDVLVSIEIRA